MYEEGAEAFFPHWIARSRSLRISPGGRLLCRRSPTKKRVGSLLLSTAARDPVRATTTAADSQRDARAAGKGAAGQTHPWGVMCKANRQRNTRGEYRWEGGCCEQLF